MLTSLLTTKLSIQSVLFRSRDVLFPSLAGWHKKVQHSGRVFAYLVVLLIIIMMVAGCTPSPIESPLDSASTPVVTMNPSLTPQYSDQKLEFERISVEHGLPQGTVNCIIQDNAGFMWFCTEEGLNRYDGYGFKVYKHNPQNPNSLSHNQVTALVEDEEGLLWIATNEGGLDRYDRWTDSFTHYQHKPGNPGSLANDSVWSLLFDRDGVLWIGTAVGLDRFDPQVKRFTHYRPESGDSQNLSSWAVESIYQDSEGILWIGTNGTGLYRFDPTTERFTHFQHNPDDPSSLISNYLIKAIYEDEAGDLWVGTYEGLDRLDRQTSRFTHYQHNPSDPHSLSCNRIASLDQDPSGQLWVGTHGGGLDLLNPTVSTFRHYRSAPRDIHSLSSNIVLSLYEDQMGLLWIGTAGGGVNRVDPLAGRFSLFRNDPADSNNLSNNIVQAILEDRQGILWIGTLGSGLDQYDRESNTWRHYQNNPADPFSLSNNTVSALYEDREGLLWIGTSGDGLNLFDPETLRFTRFPYEPDDPTGLGNPFVYAIAEDREGRIWIATDMGAYGGLHRFDRDTELFTHFREGLSSNWVRALHEDHTGALWISTAGDGLNRFDPVKGSFDHYRHNPNDPKSLSHNTVTAIQEDHLGVLWLGTNGGGLNKLDPETNTFVHYTMQDGLPSNEIYGIIEEGTTSGIGSGARGVRLWISTNNGLSRFDPSTETFRNYNARDGLQGNVFSSRAHYKSSSGEIFFGGVNGFNAFYPEQIKDNPIVPPVLLTSLTQLTRSGDDVTLGTDLEGELPIVLRWPNNAFEFEFAALNFIQPDKNQHAYKLAGFDKEWNYVGTRRYGKYTNLPGGTYILRLIGSNNDGIWNEEGASVSIKIVPPFWGTWWFRGILLFLLAGAVFVVYRLRVRSIELRSRELEKQVAERTTELRHEIDQRIQVEEALRHSEGEKAIISERNRLARDLHDSVAQSMYGVMLLSEVTSQLLASGQIDSVANYLGDLKDTAQESLAEMRLLIYELRPPVLEEEGLASALQNRLEAVENRAGLETDFHVEGQIHLNAEVEEGLYRIAQEALNNALKHAQAHRVTMSLCQDKQTMIESIRVTLEIADDGIGFDLARARQGGGMGLRGMEERATAIGARLGIESIAGSGTTIRVVWECEE